jgi:hypothetical protein
LHRVRSHSPALKLRPAREVRVRTEKFVAV